MVAAKTARRSEATLSNLGFWTPARVRRLRSMLERGETFEVIAAALGARSVDAIASFLGEKPFFMGAEPLGVDATMFAFAAGALCPLFDTPIRSAAERHANLKGYVGRMMERFYPDFGRATAAA